MSDALKALNTVFHKAAEREGKDVNPEDLAEHREKLLELISEVAGDAIEDHVKAEKGVRVKHIKTRVYREIVKRIAVHFCDVCDNPEQAFAIVEDVREILASFDIETTDYTGRPVKIS